MDKIEKFLQKLTAKEKLVVKKIIKALLLERFEGLDVKKLKGHSDIFRVRKGSIRIIYQKKNKDLIIFKIDRRKENTYKL